MFSSLRTTDSPESLI